MSPALLVLSRRNGPDAAIGGAAWTSRSAASPDWKRPLLGFRKDVGPQLSAGCPPFRGQSPAVVHVLSKGDPETETVPEENWCGLGFSLNMKNVLQDRRTHSQLFPCLGMSFSQGDKSEMVLLTAVSSRWFLVVDVEVLEGVVNPGYGVNTGRHGDMGHDP